jgi:ABC-type nitrate/sulfonate/bicarbonate transport system ATPase subunit
MLQIHNLTFRYADSSYFLFRSFNLMFENEITCIVGRNGVGKSSLFEIVTDSFIEFKKGKRSLIGFDSNTNLEIIHQKPDLSILPWHDSVRNLEVITGIKKQIFDKTWFENSLADFGINPSSKVGNLSGGQKQVINILKALVLQPNLLLMDEPFGALDIENSSKLKKIMLVWQKTNQACIILISHSVEDIIELADRAVIFDCNPIEIVQDLNRAEISSDGRLIINQHFEL